MFGLLRFLFRASCTLIVAQWLYAETLLFAPTLERPLQKVFENVQLPTHDQWSEEFKKDPLAYVQEKFSALKGNTYL